MSMPRATMSVATRIETLLFLKSSITSSRWACSRSECMAATLSFMRLSVWASSLTFIFDDEKMIVFDSVGSANISRMMSSFWFS